MPFQVALKSECGKKRKSGYLLLAAGGFFLGFHLENFHATIVSAVAADLVGGIGLAALGTGSQTGLAQGIVSPAHASAGVRMAAFWIRHG